MSTSIYTIVTIACAGLLGAVVMSAPVSAAPLPASNIASSGMNANVDGQPLVTPVRNMGNGKHPSRAKGQKRRGTTSGGPRY